MDLNFVIHHVFLPPELPQCEDEADAKASYLIDTFYNALVSFQDLTHGGKEFDSAIKMVLAMKPKTSGASIPIPSKKTIQTMSTGDVLGLRMRAQNAGIIIRRYDGEYRFESFELSPITDDVTGTKGRLRRTFPGPAVAIPDSKLNDPALVDAILHLLEHLDTDLISEAQPKTSKGRSNAVEPRQTTDPMFVTQMLTGILRGNGAPCEVERFEKRTRDEALWDDCLLPWRRSSDWLLLRVALQSTLLDKQASNHHIRYKQFMVFFMSQILNLASEASFPSSVLFVMIAKISRRICKLQLPEDSKPLWLENVRQVLATAHDKITKRWEAIEKNEDPKGTQKALKLNSLSRDSDTALKLQDLAIYRAKIANRVPLQSNFLLFVPDCQERLDQNALFPSIAATILGKSVDDGKRRLSLADVELWVQDYLGVWLNGSLEYENSCVSLASLIDAYLVSALAVYGDSPIDKSIMVLTLMELWVALDKCATTQQPLLKQYPTGFPGGGRLLAPLLLPKKQQMERLSLVEDYITGRAKTAGSANPSIFTNINTPNCFAVKYFNQSTLHQNLRRNIEAAAQCDRNRKIIEFETKKAQYREKMDKYNQLQCTESEVTYRMRRHLVTELRHIEKRCPKCQLHNDAQNMSIEVHEWPLPGKIGDNNDLETKSAIFELSVPSSILQWRDTTYRILVDVLSPELRPDYLATHALANYDGLSEVSKGSFGRIQLASTAKPFRQSHYRSQRVSQAVETSICVDHGSHYAILDSMKSRWSKDMLGRCNIEKQCTFQLPSGPFEQLQYAVNSTDHTSNEVLASQAKCPTVLSLHEYYAFGILRAGHLLQWRNIAREIVSSALNFNHKETLLLVSQAAWQAGLPSDCIHRQAHVDLQEEGFGICLISTLKKALTAVEGNWQGASVVRVFTIVAARLLSLSSNSTIQNHCLEFLLKVRIITLQWIHDVLHSLHDTQNETKAKEFSERALELALTCYTTFDIDFEHCSQILKSQEDIAIITYCSIIIHDHSPAFRSALPGYTKTLLQRYHRLAHMVEPVLRQTVLADSTGLDETIREIWAGYEPGRSWSALSSPNERWLVTRTSNSRYFSPSEVHFNILDGTLLVNGSPLTRLPPEYEKHITYRRLFAEKVLDVVPSTMTGMVFETQREFQGHKVYFAKYDDELIIRTRKGTTIHELLPIHCVAEDIPQRFVSNYTHWLDVKAGIIEWRPLEHPWSASPNNWRLVDVQNERFLTKGLSQKKLVDIRSSTSKAISRALSPLEDSRQIQIVLDQNTGSLEVHLPRFKLDFFVLKNSTSIESKQFRGMRVDTNQSFGSLTGLVSKLVLNEIRGTSRLVLVPDGKPLFMTCGDHVNVRIKKPADPHTRADKPTEFHIIHHQYRIDDRLGLLEDNRSLRSRLFRIYLHALTSHCLPDSLTGRTGTEEALFALRRASTKSFLELEEKHFELLEWISKLTLKREYYPHGMKLMQSIQWNGLPALSQHESFSKEVESIMVQVNTFQLFRDKSRIHHKLSAQAPADLLERAAMRSSSYRVDGFGAEDHTVDNDSCYQSRDGLTNCTNREALTCLMTRLVVDMSRRLKPNIDLLQMSRHWSVAHGASGATSLELDFNEKWLCISPESFLSKFWCALHKVLSDTIARGCKHKFMIFMSTLAFSQMLNPDLCQAVLALATVPAMHQISVPQEAIYRLHEGYAPNKDILKNIFETAIRPFEKSDQSKLPKLTINETDYDADARRKREFDNKVDKNINMCLDHLINEWNRSNPSPSLSENYGGGECNRYIDIAKVNMLARPHFESWHRNVKFRKYITEVQGVLNNLEPCNKTPDTYSFSTSAAPYQPLRAHVNITDLLYNAPPAISESLVLNEQVSTSSTSKTSADINTISPNDVEQEVLTKQKGPGKTNTTNLKDLLRALSSHTEGAYESEFVHDLHKSLESFEQQNASTLHHATQIEENLLKDFLLRSEKSFEAVTNSIYDALRFASLKEKSYMLPRLSPSIILSLLAHDNIHLLTPAWKHAIVYYGLTISNMQRAQRLVACLNNNAELMAELSNPGHVDWSPMDTPEWLLLEIENNILIRKEQAQIGKRMIEPESGENSVMQLNMGLGKSSVIVPIVAATLADGAKFVRIIVLRPLTKQMFELLTQKLGGMINRRIFYMPISRSLQLTVADAHAIDRMYKDCAKMGGILLVQPEHVLSFELMGLDQSLQGDEMLGHAMVQTQKWLHENSRDILDESDEILSVNFELIYTMGAQRSIDFSPDRWSLIALVLDEVLRKVPQVASSIRHGLEVLTPTSGSVPRIRILKEEAGTELLSKVAREICNTGLPGVPLWKLQSSVRDILFKYLTDPTMPESEVAGLEEVFDTDSMRMGLLLLRGLFAHGILNFVFSQKRWRVNYGLDLSRSMLSVPYQAKDTPSTRAEFSHPDTTIILTYLSYYYGGLNNSQMFASFEKLLRCDAAQQEYDKWTVNIEGLPETFVKVSGINLSNTEQCRNALFPKLRFSKGVVDFYMAHLVFPKEMKEFPHKLSSSGWDIARDKSHPTTGFSGTNDSRALLPISIKQRDLPQLLSTNAAVLDCLLRTENSFDVSYTVETEVLNAVNLLEMAVKLEPPARVILDVGAQVLELRNEEVATKWISMVEPTEADAVVFCDDNNNLCVIDRDGLKELLSVSPFLKQMDRCLVFLDEAHTRGTDLKLPSDYRAIVTLGPGLTKDRLVQACMRMRKLGKGQSIVICGPLEVQQKILELNSKSLGETIDILDVLKWCIHNTWTHTRKCVPLWATQGVRHYRRHGAISSEDHVTDEVLEPEAQSLEERYGFKRRLAEERVIMYNTPDLRLSTKHKELEAIRQKCRDFGLTSFTNATLQEEQERELQPEQEREQQVERPPQMESRKHTLHPDVKEFVTTGKLNTTALSAARSIAFHPAFKTLLGTTAARKLDTQAWPGDLLVTRDFAITIAETDVAFLDGTPASQPMDSFLRPVHWLVSSCSEPIFVVLSPFEVNELMPIIRHNKKVRLHVYSPRLSQSYDSLEKLSFCALYPVPVSWAPPKAVITQLNLFAGQLYLKDFFEYKALCRFLGLCSEPPDDETKVGPDGFIVRAANEADTYPTSKFNKSPVGFVRRLVAMRCKGQDFSSSHMGKILNGELIRREDFKSKRK